MSTATFAQVDAKLDNRSVDAKPGIRQSLNVNSIRVNPSNSRNVPSPRLATNPKGSISVSTSVLKEVENVFTGLYDTRTKVVGLSAGGQSKGKLNFVSNVGLKGLEAKAIGAFSRKRGSMFNVDYRYSLEDEFMKGMGHSIRIGTRF